MIEIDGIYDALRAPDGLGAEQKAPALGIADQYKVVLDLATAPALNAYDASRLPWLISQIANRDSLELAEAVLGDTFVVYQSVITQMNWCAERVILKKDEKPTA